MEVEMDEGELKKKKEEKNFLNKEDKEEKLLQGMQK